MKMLISLFLTVAFYCYGAPNTVLIIIDGASQDTFYQLLRSHQLPNIETLVERGNTRTLNGLDDPNDRLEAYRILLSGHSSEEMSEARFISNGDSIFEQLDRIVPEITTGVLLHNTIPLADEPVENLSLLISSVKMTLDIDHEPMYRSSNEISDVAINDIEGMTRPFFYVLNFVNIDFVGRRYREGSELYSLGIRNCDKAIGKLLTRLRELGEDESTEFIIVSPYGMKRKTQEFSSDAWIVSTQKVFRKGTLLDIVPSIMSLYVSDEIISEFNYSGSSLFRLE